MLLSLIRTLRESRPGSSGEPPGRPETARQVLDGVAEAARIRCRACGSPLAEVAAVFAPSDAPLVFANPAGMVFELRAVRSAPGVRAFGDATTEATWFSGYAWRAGLCAACHRHVGWQFLSVEPSRTPSEFFGLIVREIIEG